MFKIFANLLLKMLLGKLKDFVLVVITDLTLSDLTNDEKRKAAFEKIKEEARLAGKDLRESVINLAIELSVQLIRK
jgi:hypothetical protein